MRTYQEIVDRARASDSWLGFDLEILLPYLPFESAKSFLKREIEEEDWVHTELTRDIILEEARIYMTDYGWPKAMGHRGISAERTVIKMTEWMWLLEEDDLLDQMTHTDYAQYGTPILKLICEKMDWPIPTDEDTILMMNGHPCRAEYECGCSL